MVTVGARELKMRLGTYLRRVREGTVILVTERGRPIAELRPLPRAASDEDERLLEMAAKGLVTARTATLDTLPSPIKIQGRSLADTIVEEREDGL